MQRLVVPILPVNYCCIILSHFSSQLIGSDWKLVHPLQSYLSLYDSYLCLNRWILLTNCVFNGFDSFLSNNLWIISIEKLLRIWWFLLSHIESYSHRFIHSFQSSAPSLNRFPYIRPKDKNCYILTKGISLEKLYPQKSRKI